MTRQDPIDKLARSPLALVIGQIRFPVIPKLAEKIENIHESMREIGFDRLKPETVQQFTFGTEVTSTKVSRWVFTNRDRTEAVFVTQDFIVLAMSNYDEFEAFMARLGLVSDVVRRHAKVNYYEQVGLRYLNLLRFIDDLTPCQLVANGLRGLSVDVLKANATQSQSVVRCQTDFGMLTLRCLELVGPGFLPPDLQIEGMKFLDEPNPEEWFRLLDIDNTSSFEDGKDFENLTDTLWKLHRHTSLGFRNSVTSEALACWRKAK